MRVRYSAYALQLIDFLVVSTVPSQQALLNTAAMAQWSASVVWQGLKVLRHAPKISPCHAAVDFQAYFADETGTQVHEEHSIFVWMSGRWYFLDLTVALPSPKALCLCGSGKKWKHCCGKWLEGI